MLGLLTVPDLVVPPRFAGSFTRHSIHQLLTFDLHSSIPILPLRTPSSMYHGQGIVTMLGLAGGGSGPSPGGGGGGPGGGFGPRRIGRVDDIRGPECKSCR